MRCVRLLFQNLIKRCGKIFANGFFNVGHLDLQGLFAKGDCDNIADLYIVGGLGRAVIDNDMRCVAGIVSHCAALDDTRHF